MRRLTHIDNAKALGMVFIVASHIGITNNAINNIYTLWCDILGSFYVPLFFILSDCFESQTYDITKLKKRIIKLIKYCVIFYTFGVIMDGIICNHWTLTHCTSQTTIWFLFVLIWITLIVGILKKYKFNYIIYIVLTICGIVLSYNHTSFVYLGQSCLCLPFYLFGYYSKNILKRGKFNWLFALWSLLGWLILFVLFYRPQNISLNLVNQNYIAFYAEAILGSIFVIEICKLFNNKYFSYFGSNTIVPMMIQIPIIHLLGKYYEIQTIGVYYISAIILNLLCYICIPIFRNKQYDIFK